MKEIWNERYSDDDYYYGTIPNHFLTSIEGILPNNAHILCLAEGEGRNAVYLASLGHHVTAVDFSLEGKKKAESLAMKKNLPIHYVLSSLEDYSFGVEKWDAVISIFCHLPSTIRPLIHQKVEKSLKLGGLFILQSYTPEQLEHNTGGPKDLSMLYTENLIKNDFSYLKWVKLQREITEVFEGKGHTGLSSVLNAVGVKE